MVLKKSEKETDPKPVPLSVVIENIPIELKERKHWVCWRYEWREDKKGQGRWTKPPYNPLTGRLAKTNNPATWVTFEEAYKAYKNGKYEGIGFTLHPDDDLTGLDLDHCLDNKGSLVSWAEDLLDHFPEVYWEHSPGGNGLRGFCYGTPHRSGQFGPNNWIEVYQPPSHKYLTVTGRPLNGVHSLNEGQAGLDWLHETYPPKEPRTQKTKTSRPQSGSLHWDDQSLLEKAMNAHNGTYFSALWKGDLSEHNDDHSAADLALCNELAFWTCRDPHRMDRLFRTSSLMREKWDKVHYADGRTYGEGTIQEALIKCTKTYNPEYHQASQSAAKMSHQDIRPPDQEAFTIVSWDIMRKRIGPIEWDWEGWLPTGLLTILASDPGVGKSALALRIAATFAQGLPWPDGTPYQQETGTVVWCEAECAEAINLERAANWKIPMNRILDPLGCDPPVSVMLDMPQHKNAVHAAAAREDVRFIVVDSLRGIHRGNEDSSGMMEVVSWLASLARDTGKPILLTHHLRKRGKRDGAEVTLDRLRGSSAIVQPARVVWALDAPDPSQTTKRMTVIKSNIARFPDPLGFMVGEEGVSFGEAPLPSRNETVIDRAVELLLTLLNKAPMQAGNVLSALEDEGVSKNTIYKAKERLNIVVIRKGKKAFWSLPAHQESKTELN